MKKLVLASLILASSQMAVAVNWVENPSNVGNGTMFIDIDSIKKHYFPNNKGFYLTAWIRNVSPIVKYVDGKPYNIKHIFMYIDCNNEKSSFEEIVGYYNNNINPVAHERYNVIKHSSDSWSRFPPTTLGAEEIKAVCNAYQIGLQYGYQF